MKWGRWDPESGARSTYQCMDVKLRLSNSKKREQKSSHELGADK
jgi:hypothetical protein